MSKNWPYSISDALSNMTLVYGCPPDMGIKPLEIAVAQPLPIDPFTGDPLQTYTDQAKEIARLKDLNMQYMADKIALLEQVRDLQTKLHEAEKQLLKRKGRGNVP
jgi:hypothetical protein